MTAADQRFFLMMKRDSLTVKGVPFLSDVMSRSHFRLLKGKSGIKKGLVLIHQPSLGAPTGCAKSPDEVQSPPTL